MKRKLTLACLLLLCGVAISTTAQAQSLRWGVLGGANFASGPSVTNGFKADGRTGFHAGPTIELDMGLLPIAADAALLFSSNKSEIKDAQEAWDTLVTTNYIELPVRLKWTFFDLGILDFKLMAGPSFSYLVSDNLKGLTSQLGDGFTPPAFHRFSVGLNAGIGAEILGFVQVHALYSAQFADSYNYTGIGQAANDFIKARNKGFRLSVAAYF